MPELKTTETPTHKMKYVGAEAFNLGRFGWVSPNDVITVTESEYANIYNDPRFQEVA